MLMKKLLLLAEKLRLHVTFWFIYGLYFYGMNVLENPRISWLTVIVTIPVFAVVFYSVLGILVKYFLHGKHWRGATYLILFYGLSGLLIYYVLYGMNNTALYYGNYLVPDRDFNWREFVQSVLVMMGNFSILALLYFQYRRKLYAAEQKTTEMEKRLEAEKLKSRYEYTSLAAQVSPHIMATIFDDWKKKANPDQPELAAIVEDTYQLMLFYMKASDMDGPETILLQEEIQQVKRFLKIQHTSSHEQLHFSWNITGNVFRFVVPPTTLLSLVKNALKHGDLSDPGTPLQIDISTGADAFSLTISNRLRKGKSTASHGTGLKNLERRLDLIFGDCYSFNTTKTDNEFIAHLHVTI